MYVALPVGIAAEREARSMLELRHGHTQHPPPTHTHSTYKSTLCSTHTHQYFLYEYIWKLCFSCFCPFSCLHYGFKKNRLLALSLPVSLTRTLTHTSACGTLFIFCRLIPERQFLWSPIYVSSQTANSPTPPPLLLLSPLPHVSVSLYMCAQWNNGTFQ